MIQTVANDISEILRVSVIDDTPLYDRVHAYFSNFTAIIEQPTNPDAQDIKASIKAIHVLDDSLNNFMRLYVRLNPSAHDRVGTILWRKMITKWNRAITGCCILFNEDYPLRFYLF